jgi:hypothetical protein
MQRYLSVIVSSTSPISASPPRPRGWPPNSKPWRPAVLGWLRSAHYPLEMRLVSFEFNFQPSIDGAVIAELSTLRIRSRESFLVRSPGT